MLDSLRIGECSDARDIEERHFKFFREFVSLLLWVSPLADSLEKNHLTGIL